MFSVDLQDLLDLVRKIEELSRRSEHGESRPKWNGAAGR
jgi:hypothetical protein